MNVSFHQYLFSVLQDFLSPGSESNKNLVMFRFPRNLVRGMDDSCLEPEKSFMFDQLNSESILHLNFNLFMIILWTSNDYEISDRLISKISRLQLYVHKTS